MIRVATGANRATDIGRSAYQIRKWTTLSHMIDQE